MERVLGEVVAISEEDRHQMYSKLEEVLGAQVANTVMEHLPPVGWADIATKRDLDAQSERLELLLRAEIRGEINRLMLWLFPTILTALALAFAAGK
jgi:hypothetical protein